MFIFKFTIDPMIIPNPPSDGVQQTLKLELDYDITTIISQT